MRFLFLYFSVRINERKVKGHSDNKKMAYLVDLKTINVQDLVFGTTVAQVSAFVLEKSW